MKILKNTERENFTVDTDYYVQAEIDEMVEAGLITRLTFYDFDNARPAEIVYVVYTRDCSSIAVEYAKDTDYCVMVTHKCGIKIHVEL